MVLVVTHNLAKVKLRVRFPLPAPRLYVQVAEWSNAADCKPAIIVGSNPTLYSKQRKRGRAWFNAPVLKTDVRTNTTGREFESHRFRQIIKQRMRLLCSAEPEQGAWAGLLIHG